MKARGVSGMTKSYDFSTGKRGSILSHKGKTRITIWIDNEVLDWFRSRAEREGSAYQTMLNAALKMYTGKGHAPLRKIVRDVVREELRARKAS